MPLRHGLLLLILLALLLITFLRASSWCLVFNYISPFAAKEEAVAASAREEEAVAVATASMRPGDNAEAEQTKVGGR